MSIFDGRRAEKQYFWLAKLLERDSEARLGGNDFIANLADAEGQNLGHILSLRVGAILGNGVEQT